MGKEIKFENGGIWEEYQWTIRFDYEHVYNSKEKIPCKHCLDEREIVKTRWSGEKYTRKACTVPRVVVARNEGGFNSTGVCLDCILEAAASIEGEVGKCVGVMNTTLP